MCIERLLSDSETILNLDKTIKTLKEQIVNIY